jgi:hypothetical protein
MKIIIPLIAILLVATLFGQTQMKPSVADSGGGIVTGGSFKMLASIGQAVPGIATGATTLQAGYITVELVLTTDIKEPTVKPPEAPIIGEFYPNPFNSTSRITIALPKPDDVGVEICDLGGKQVFSWSEHRGNGKYTLTFNPTDNLPSGTYLYSVHTSGAKKTGKITLVR